MFNDKPNPQEVYSQFKYAAEISLQKIAKDKGMEFVIIRPPLVYGPNTVGNFSRFVKLAYKNFPLPLGSIHNKCSFVGVDNLINLIKTCIVHPNACNDLFLVSDDHDVSTIELFCSMVKARGGKPRLFSVSYLTFTLGLFGRKKMIDKFTSSLQVDISHTKETLDWKPLVSFDVGIRRCFIRE
jgi:nucleoside-diphosphate-sugar epimerase